MADALMFESKGWRAIGGAALGFLVLALVALPVRVAAAGLGLLALMLTSLLAPAASLVVLALMLPFGDLLALPGGQVGSTDAVALLALAAWLIRQLALRKALIRHLPMGWIQLLFVWVMALSLTQAATWRLGVPELLKWAQFVAVYFVAVQVLGPQTRRWVVAALFIAGGAQACIGVYQFLTQTGPEAFGVLGRYMRAHGTLRQPNPYAGYLGYLLPVAASLAMGALTAWRKKHSAAILGVGLGCAALAALLALGIVLSWSRGAWLGLAATAAVVLGLMSRKVWTVTLAAVVGAFLLVAFWSPDWLPKPVTDRLAELTSYALAPSAADSEVTDANFSVLERVAHWQAGLRMFSDRPWLGVGIGNYEAAYAAYAAPPWYDPLGHAHNMAINFLAETGVLGTTAFILVWVAAARMAWRARRTDRELSRAFAIGIVGTWTYLTVHSLFDSLFVQHMQLQLALLLGCLVADEARAT